MNSTLRELLHATGLPEDYLRSLRWSDVLIAHNHRAVPPSAHAMAEHVRYGGFNFILLDRNGSPAYFCKCRSATDDEVAHETAVMEVLSRNTELCAVIPETHGFCSASVRVQVSRYVEGESFEAVVPRLGIGAWTASMEEVLAIMSRIAAHAEACLRGLFPGASSIDFLDATQPALGLLAEAGLGPDAVSALAACLRSAGRAARMLQHGDLWPGNIIVDRGSWRILDFTRYGCEPMPMFDAYHLVRGCSELRRGKDDGVTAGTWLELMSTDSRLARAARQTLRRALERHALTPSQGIGALAGYVALLAARLISRRSPFFEPFVREAQYLAHGLRRGVPFGAALFSVR